MSKETIKGGIGRRFRQLDVFRKIPKDFTEASSTGATVSLTCMVVISLLIISEFHAFLSITTQSEMFVEPPANLAAVNEKLRINFDFTFPVLPCAVLSVDSEDVMGISAVNIGGTLQKLRLNRELKVKKDRQGNPLQSPILAGEADAMAQRGEGCRLFGYMLVNKVPGNFHISAHARPGLLSVVIPKDTAMNLTHFVNHLSFGKRVPNEVSEDVISAFRPLDGLKRQTTLIPEFEQFEHDGHVHSMPTSTESFEYYLKIVPTIYEDLTGFSMRSYQFTSSTARLEGVTDVPAIYFRYDFSPITVHFSPKTQRFSHFLVEVLAIVGGIFTVFSLMSSCLDQSLERLLTKKRELGKLI